MQGRLVLVLSAPSVDQVGMGVEQSLQLVDAASLRGAQDAIGRLLDLRRARVALLELAGEQFDRSMPGRPGNLVDGLAVVIDQAGIEASLKGAANRIDIALAGCVEDAFAVLPGGIHRVNMGLEPLPTGEAVLACDRALRGGEPGTRILVSQRLEALLGLVSQMLQAWPRGQCPGATRGGIGIISHAQPSFHLRPASANFGQEVRFRSDRHSAGCALHADRWPPVRPTEAYRNWPRLRKRVSAPAGLEMRPVEPSGNDSS